MTSPRCKHALGCPHWDHIMANGRRFAAMVSAAQKRNPLYTALDAQCAHRFWTGVEWMRCLDRVWVRAVNGTPRRVQTPYCEAHARQFSADRDACDEYRYA